MDNCFCFFTSESPRTGISLFVIISDRLLQNLINDSICCCNLVANKEVAVLGDLLVKRTSTLNNLKRESA